MTPLLKRMPILLLLGTCLALAGCGDGEPPVPQKPGGLQAGDKAYDFSLSDSDGRIIKMSDLKPGWSMVLILYRGHWCSACQEQLSNLKEDYPRFQELHSTIVAVSVDPVEDSAAFNAQWRFPFPLLSDPLLKVIDAYGARHPRGHEGKDIARPTVILIDPQKFVRFKFIGKDPTDRPTDNEILFNLKEMEKREGILPK
ncbi:MAG TPA: peroxiredoxin family protein [bacterium]|nr:peroxiredoxin family protein [bacterium]